MIEKMWWHNSVVYQVYPKSFNDTTGNGIGDIPGIIEKLDYLAYLGVDVIWLSPVYKSPMKDNGYDISDYEDINPLFGSMDDMKKLIKEAKNREIKIVMDLVVNHTSDQHPWFIESKKSKDSPYRDYYIWREKPNDMKSVFGGSAWEYDSNTKEYYFHNFAKEQPDLNWENEKVINEVFNMMNRWIDMGIAGFRMDVIDLIGKNIDKGILENGPRLHELLQRMNKETFGDKNLITVGETWGATPEIAKLYSDPKRKELSMIFQFEHMTIDWGKYGKWTPKDLNVKELKKILEKWQTCFEDDGWNSLFWNNHDLPRIVSRWGDDGKYRVKSAKMLGILLHFMKGTPYIYQGEEIGMTNVKYDSLDKYDDVEIHGSYRDLVIEDKKMSHDDFMEGVYKMSRDNARTPMQWDRSKNAGFSEGNCWLDVNPNYKEINVESALKDKNSIFYTYKTLIELRKQSKYSDLIVYGDFEMLLKEDESIFAYKRFYKNQELYVVANFSSKEVVNTLEVNNKNIIMTNYLEPNSNNFSILRPYETVVFEII